MPSELSIVADSLRTQLIQQKRKLHELESKKAALESDLVRFDSDKKEAIEINHKKAYEQYKRQLVSDVEQEQQQVEKKLVELQKKHDAKQQDFANAEEACNQSENPLVSRLESLLQETIDYSSSFIGERLTNKIITGEKTKVVQLSEKDIPKTIKYFKAINKKVQSFSSSKTDSLIQYCIDLTGSVNTENIEKDVKKLTAFAIGSLIILLLFTKYVLPFYVFVLLFFIVYNCIRVHVVYDALLSIKEIRENLEEIKKDLIQRELDKIISRKNQEQQSFEKKKTKLEDAQVALQGKYEKIVQESLTTFVPDDSNIIQSFQDKKAEKDQLLSNVSKELFSVSSTINELEQKLNEAVNKYNAELESEIMKYKDPTVFGSSFTTNFNFLFDYRDHKPIFFKFPQKSCLILYDADSEELVPQFIALITFQLRQMLNPLAYSVKVFDNIKLASQYVRLSSSTDDTSKKASADASFCYVSQDTEIKESIVEQANALRIKAKNIFTNFNDIDAYNKFMLENDSLTESFEFLFYHLRNPATYRESNFVNLLTNGSSAGVYPIVFLNKTTFATNGKESQALVSNAQSCFVLSESAIEPKSAAWCQNLIVK